MTSKYNCHNYKNNDYSLKDYPKFNSYYNGNLNDNNWENHSILNSSLSDNSSVNQSINHIEHSIHQIHDRIIKSRYEHPNHNANNKNFLQRDNLQYYNDESSVDCFPSKNICHDKHEYFNFNKYLPSQYHQVEKDHCKNYPDYTHESKYYHHNNHECDKIPEYLPTNYHDHDHPDYKTDCNESIHAHEFNLKNLNHDSDCKYYKECNYYQHPECRYHNNHCLKNYSIGRSKNHKINNNNILEVLGETEKLIKEINHDCIPDYVKKKDSRMKLSMCGLELLSFD